MLLAWPLGRSHLSQAVDEAARDLATGVTYRARQHLFSSHRDVSHLFIEQSQSKSQQTVGRVASFERCARERRRLFPVHGDCSGNESTRRRGSFDIEVRS